MPDADLTGFSARRFSGEWSDFRRGLGSIRRISSGSSNRHFLKKIGKKYVMIIKIDPWMVLICSNLRT
jgi:hypothetical protein